MPSSLIWFNHNLRLHDNEVLHIAAEKKQPLICWYCIDSSWFKKDQYGLNSMGEHRWRFLRASLDVFKQQLSSVGQRLYVTYGDPVERLGEVIEKYDVNCLISQHQAGTGTEQWSRVQKRYPQLSYYRPHGYTLFKPEQLKSLTVFPRSFSQFRPKLEKLDVLSPRGCPSELPPPLRLESSMHNSGPPVNNEEPVIFSGGEVSGLSHVEAYFSNTAASTYKETRNALMGWSTSTKFSPWLASGSLSVRYLFRALKDFENQHESNDSTHWIYIELLWREYFQWYAKNFKKQLFDFQGISQRKPLTTFYPQRFKQWINGTTGWPIVNACMNELRYTGYLSNRGRQLAASCLVNELGLDWRCGAAYFEQQLIDYDVGSNWGNWQYIAGVGADPRGGRHFNLDKQAKMYDPEGHYCKRWLDQSASQRSNYSLNSVDIADWPIGP